MANTNVKSRLVALPVDTTVINLTIPGETRLPTGCVIQSSFADLGSLGDANGVIPVFEGSYCYGVSDFTDVATVSNTALHDASPVEVSTVHDDASGDIVRILTPGGTTPVRTVSVAPIAGGIALTPGEPGQDFILQVTFIFGAECKAFSDGGEFNNGETIVVAHGLSGKPECGFISGTSIFQGSVTTRATPSWGLFSDNGTIKQSNIVQRANGTNTARVRGNASNSRVHQSLLDNGNVLWSWELTSNDGTNTIFTVHGNAISPSLIGLLVHMGDVSADLQVLDTPTSTIQNWVHAGAGFVPQYAQGLISRAIGEGDIDRFNASTMGITEFDNAGFDSSLLWSVRHNVNPSSNYSLVSDGLIWSSGNQGITSSAYTVSFTSNGFNILAVDIQIMDPVSRKFPVLFIEESGSTTPNPTLSGPTASPVGVSQAQGTVNTDSPNGTIFGVITQSAVTPTHLQIAAGLDDIGAPADSSAQVSALATSILNFFGLATGNIYFAHYTQISAGGSESTNQVTSASFQTSDINLSPVVVSQIPGQTVTIGTAYNFDVSGFFDDPDGDPLTYTGINMPSGLSMNPAGVISGVPTGGGSAPTEISSISFNFGSLRNVTPGNGQSALESDNYPITWHADNDQYTSFGDGMGFGNLAGNENTRASIGFMRIEGNENNYSAFDVFKSGKNMPNSETGKCYGILGANGKLYSAWDFRLLESARPGRGSGPDRYEESTICSSANGGVSWTEEIRWNGDDWGNDLNGFFGMSFVNYGQDHGGGRSPKTDSDYIYLNICENSDGAYECQIPGGMSLIRVLATNIESGNKAHWEYLSGINAQNDPSWSTVLTNRINHFQDSQDGNDTSSMIYNEPLGRYILTTFHNTRNTGPGNNDCFIGFYDAPEPWGPWHTILKTNVQNLGLADGNAVIFWNMSNKWLSNDGLSGVLVGTLLGQDEFGTIEYTLTVG